MHKLSHKYVNKTIICCIWGNIHFLSIICLCLGCVHACVCPYRNIQSLNMPFMPVIKLENYHGNSVSGTASGDSLQPVPAHRQREVEHEQVKYLHIKEPRWPAYCCLKAPINSPLIRLQVGGRGLQMLSQSNKRWKCRGLFLFQQRH